MLNQILFEFKNKVNGIVNKKELHDLRISYLGKEGIVTLQLKQFTKLNINERKEIGKQIHAIKLQIESLVTSKLCEIEEQEMHQSLAAEKIDVTLPSRKLMQGSIHPISQAIEEMINILAQFNFKIVEGPNIENDWYNFTALNMPGNHPARQMHDTFYLNNASNNNLLLRTHTSNVSIRTMEHMQPPIYIAAPGRTYRADSDATHTPMFHQMEGLIVDKNLHMGHLKYIVNKFLKMFFGIEDIEIMFRPSFFPFTEPSAEVDIKYPGQSKWLEVLGCGMLHPNVLRNVNIDPNEYQGLAFGVGIERLAMLKYGINDLRKLFENDQRWLKHYSFTTFNIPSTLRGLNI